MKKRKTSSSAFVYSTDPTFIQPDAKMHIATPPPEDQKLSISLDSKHRAGKVVTLIAGFVGSDDDREQLCKQLKSFCGTGGAVKDGAIIIQGDNRDKIFQKLSHMGYKQLKKR